MMAKKTAPHHEHVVHHYKHAHLYYLTMISSMIMLVLCLVQAVIYHVEGNLGLAVGLYTISVLFLVVAHSSYVRGKGHYHYHRHIG